MGMRLVKKKHGLRLLLRPNGVYYIRMPRSSGPRSLDTSSKPEASTQFEMAVKQHLAGNSAKIEQAKSITLKDFSTAYMEHRNIQHELGHLSAATVRADDLALRMFIKHLGNMQIHKVDRTAIDRFKMLMLASGKDKEKRKSTANSYMRLLRAAWQWARSEDPGAGKLSFVSGNPFMKAPGARPVLFELEQTGPKHLTTADIKALMEHLRDGNVKWLVLFFLYTGMRRAEVCRLDWRDIDLDRGVIHVHKTKTKTSRTVPIITELRQIIIDMKPRTSGPVFSWDTPSMYSELVKDALRGAGIKDRTLHSLRHTYASFLVMNNVDLKTVQGNLGHKNPRTTDKYTHVDEGHRCAATERLDFGIM